MLSLVQQSQNGTPVLIIPNKGGAVRFIINYRRLNQKLVTNTYPLPRIGKMMHQLGCFHYATALDLRAVYYTIRLSVTSQYMMKIAT